MKNKPGKTYEKKILTRITFLIIFSLATTSIAKDVLLCFQFTFIAMYGSQSKSTVQAISHFPVFFIELLTVNLAKRYV